jgi:hypothetical protein
MKIIRVIVAATFLNVLLWSSSGVYAQTSDQSKKKIRSFGKGVIVTKDRKRHPGTNIDFYPEIIQYNKKTTNEMATVPLSDVDHVRAKVGSHVLEGALGGGGLMAASVLLALAEIEADPYRTTVDNAGTIAAGFIIGGIVIGGLIGACFPKQKVVYKRGKFLVNTQVLPTIPSSMTDSNCLAVSLQIPL